MTDRELMQEALYALTYVGDAKEIYSDTIESLRARLAQPEQEPVAWTYQHEDTGLTMCVLTQQVEPGFEKNNPRWQKSTPLYTAPPQQHSEQWWKHEVSNAYANGYEKGRASVKQPEQEPVAWADKYDLDREGHDFWVSRQQPAKNGVPLYTAPPQREWQGLTDEEIKNHWLIAMQSVEGTVLPIPEFALAIERALKEKNA